MVDLEGHQFQLALCTLAALRPYDCLSLRRRPLAPDGLREEQPELLAGCRHAPPTVWQAVRGDAQLCSREVADAPQ